VVSFGSGDGRETWRTVGGAPPAGGPPFAIDGRYEIEVLIGAGGFGQVWRAWDKERGRHVAVKRVGAPDEHLRRETSALWLLDLPGVVTLHDVVCGQAECWLVMELVEGREFLGEDDPGTWEQRLPSIRSLLETLARVHQSGVVHADLKPSNIRLPADGAPVLLDFGVASGHAVAPHAQRREGTRLFMAPEQAAGQPIDARADLHALGRMVLRWLDCGDRAAPGEARQWAERLAAERPDDRPQSALEALRGLGGAAAQAQAAGLLGLADEHRMDASELAALFHGPDAILHFVEDGVRALQLRTGGWVDAVRAETMAWCRAGLAVLHEGRLRLRRDALDRLLLGVPIDTVAASGLSERAACLLERVERSSASARSAALSEQAEAAAELEARRLIWRDGSGQWASRPMVREQASVVGGAACATNEREDVERALVEVQARRRDGQYSAAWIVARTALEKARRHGTARHEHGLLVELWAVAADIDSDEHVRLVRYELSRAGHRGADVTALEELTRVHALLRGRPVEGREAGALEELVAHAPVPSHPELAHCYYRLRLRAALNARCGESLAREVRALEQDRRVDPVRRQALAGLVRGLRAYQLGQYVSAARYAEEVSSLATSFQQRLAAAVNAANAWLEEQRPELAYERAAAAYALAVSARHVTGELRATRLLRAAGYRTGRIRTPDRELVLAAAQVHGRLAGSIAMTEAAIAWRSGLEVEAEELARSAVIHLGGQGASAPEALLARSLLAAITRRASTVELEELARAWARVEQMELVAQGFGLLRIASPTDRWQEQCNWAAAAANRVPRGVCLDLLSLDEAAATPVCAPSWRGAR
jgi:hypothetical protein